MWAACTDEDTFAGIKGKFDQKEKDWFTTVALPGALPSQCWIRQLVEHFPGIDPTPKNHFALLLPLFSKPYMEYQCKIPIPPVQLRQAYDAVATLLQVQEFGWYAMPEYELISPDDRTQGRHHQVSVRTLDNLPERRVLLRAQLQGMSPLPMMNRPIAEVNPFSISPSSHP